MVICRNKNSEKEWRGAKINNVLSIRKSNVSDNYYKGHQEVEYIKIWLHKIVDYIKKLIT